MLEEQLRAVVAAALSDDVEIRDLRRLTGGASRETWSFEAALPDGELRPLILRRHTPGITRSGPLTREALAIEAAARAGVPEPGIVAHSDDPEALGAAFVIMDRIEGETIARRILRDERFDKVRPRLAEQCGEILARIHTIPADAVPGLESYDVLADVEGIVHAFEDPSPALELGLRWLTRNRPAAGREVVLHGDFRNGNLVVGPDGLAAVLDWELTHLGDPVEDLGWLCVKSWRFGETEHPVGGFGDVADLTAAYQAAGGRPVDPARLRWWESFGTLKWGVICEIQAQTHLQGLVRSVELATLGRRIAEMEWDLLELLGDDQPVPAESPARLGTDPRAVRPDSLQDRPSAPELVAAVREFLERDVVGTIEGRVGFHARVATNALGIVERELVLGPGLDAAARERLATFLGHDADLGTLLGELATRIRDGALDDDPEAFAVTRDTVRSKLEVSNPRYATGPA
jgi:aminoglycoside phosphotransferase (APT) family kinase protein